MSRDDEDKRAILGRRARWVAAALAGLGGPACSPQEAPANSPESVAPSIVDARLPKTERPAPKHPNDRDGDGVPDEQDKCPTEPEDKDGIDDGDGCPELDADADGVPDQDDACPKEPGTTDRAAGHPGCAPRPCLSIVPTIRVWVQIAFPKGAARISNSQKPLLDEIAQVLKEHPELRLVVHGHCSTDERQTVAADRATAVMEALVERGVPPKQLEAKGHGASEPANDSSTKELREKNRRVEFTVEEGAGGPP